MMWHLDNHHDNIVRMFINPYDMTIENGATMIFPNKYQPVYDYYKRYPYFTDEEAKKFGFNLEHIKNLKNDNKLYSIFIDLYKLKIEINNEKI